MPEVSIPGIAASDVESGRRPRNRKEILTKIAAALFNERGFPSVRMEDIASVGGVTVKALYRHFDSKQELLTHLIESSQQRFIDSVAGTADELEPARHFEFAVKQLTEASAETAHFSVLWQREARHLAPEDYSRIRARLTSMIASMSELVGQANPGLSHLRRELIAWATISCVSAPGSARDQVLAGRTAMALLRAGAPSPLSIATIDRKAIASDVDLSRRERILAAAAVTFNLSGFSATKIEAIGRMADVSGPSLYRHFVSKGELLDTLVIRGESLLWHETDTRRLPGQAADERLRSTTDALIAASLRAPDVVGIWVTDRAHASEPVEKAVANSLAAFHATWATDLHRVRPELPPETCAQLVRIAVQVVDDIVRINRLRREPTLAGELAALLAALFEVDA